MAETRTYNGHTYTRNGPGEPWTLVPSASPSGAFADPYKPQAQVNDNRRVDLQERNTQREIDRTRLQNPQDLRQEYEKLPEIVLYKSAIREAQRALSTAPNPTGDLALTYAFARAMDPSTGVRDAEQQSLYEAQPFFQSLVQRVKKTFGADDAGGFTDKARSQIRREIFSQVASIKPLYDRARADMSDNAKAVGVDPKEVIGRDDTATYAPTFRAYGEKNGDDGTISRLIGEPIKGADISVAAPQAPGVAGFGATQTQGKVPDAAQKEYAAYLNQNWGKLDPQAFAQFRAGLDQKYGLGEPNLAGYASDAASFNDLAMQGKPPQAVGALTMPVRNMSGLEQLRNDAVSNPVGAGVATAANSAGFGIPEMLAGDQFAAIRKQYPKASLVGDIGGAAAGTMLGGGLLKTAASELTARGVSPTLVRGLESPVTRDMVYGATYGGTTASGRGDNPLIGTLSGGASGFLGNRIGTAIGRGFPGLTGVGQDIRALDKSVPTSEALKSQAGDLYALAESRGLTATPEDTLALADTTKNILMQEGRLTPADRLTEVLPKAREVYNLVNDYAGQPMTPKQIQTVRGVVADAAYNATDASDKRLGKILLDNFDNWTDGTNPDLAAGLKDARGVASRYIQGDRIKMVDDLADARAGNYTQAGRGNAVRTDFRALDRGITKGTEYFAPDVTDAIRTASRGTPLQNMLRYVGKLAPTGQLGMWGTIGATTGGGAVAGPLGAAGPLALAGLGTGSRALEARMADRAATAAENAAYGGPAYSTALSDLLDRAANRGSIAGTAALAPTTSRFGGNAIQQALMALQYSGGQ